MAIEITDANFNDYLNESKPFVVDFGATWCGPCRMVSPIIDELSKEYEGKVNIGKLDVDANDATCSTYGIRNVPTILFFKGGKLVDKQVGALQKTALAEKIEALL